MRAILAVVFVALAWPALALDVPATGYVVSADVSELPKAVAEKRAALLKAAKAGDMEKLRAIFDAQAAPPNVSFGGPEDAIEYLKQESGDGEAGCAGDAGQHSRGAVCGAERWQRQGVFRLAVSGGGGGSAGAGAGAVVDGYRLLGWRGFEDQREVGGWIHWRAFIEEDGTLSSFIAGD